MKRLLLHTLLRAGGTQGQAAVAAGRVGRATSTCEAHGRAQQVQHSCIVLRSLTHSPLVTELELEPAEQARHPARKHAPPPSRNLPAPPPAPLPGRCCCCLPP